MIIFVKWTVRLSEKKIFFQLKNKKKQKSDGRGQRVIIFKALNTRRKASAPAKAKATTKHKKKHYNKMAKSWQNTKNTNWFTYLIFIFSHSHLFCQWFFSLSFIHQMGFSKYVQKPKKKHLYFEYKRCGFYSGCFD